MNVLVSQKLLALVAALVLTVHSAQAPAADGQPALLSSGGGGYEPPTDHINPEVRQTLLQEARTNRHALGLSIDSATAADLKGPTAQSSPVLSPLGLPSGAQRLSWPVRVATDNRNDFQTGVSNYLDLDTTTGSVLDYACGSRSYDTVSGYNHQGVDISSWPFPWTTMDNNGLDVVAAAPGVIVNKVSGSADRSCSFNTTTAWNVVVLAHSDGSQTVYGHLKKNSLTSKNIGDAVVAGEYLGQVGSSGVSTGPHLHFELLDRKNHPIDPFAGSCGASDSHWRWQPDYNKTRINSVQTSTAAPVLGQCDGSESPTQASSFQPGDPVYLTGFFVNQKVGDVANLTLIAPDQSVWLAVPLGSLNEPFAFSYLWRSFIAPDIPGRWRARISIDGQSSETGFTVSTGGTVAAAGQLVAAMLPGSRSVGLNQTASVFATIANAGTVPLEGCRILPLDSLSGDVRFQATDPQTNALVGVPNTPVSIGVGASRSFVVSLLPSVEVAPLNVAFNYKCNNAPRAQSVRGLNTLQFSAAAQAPADILPVSATASSDGVVWLGGTSASAAFATAAINIGTSVNGVRVVPRFMSDDLTINVCETEVSGACKAAPTPSVSANFGNAVRTFSVFVSGTGATIAFDPAATRIELSFEHEGEVRGVTSVAVTTD